MAHMSYTLNSLKGVILYRGYIGDYIYIYMYIGFRI